MIISGYDVILSMSQQIKGKVELTVMSFVSIHSCCYNTLDDLIDEQKCIAHASSGWDTSTSLAGTDILV